MTLQTRLLGVTTLAIVAALAGDLLGATALIATGFGVAALSLATLFVAMTGALARGVSARPQTALRESRTGR